MSSVACSLLTTILPHVILFLVSGPVGAYVLVFRLNLVRLLLFRSRICPSWRLDMTLDQVEFLDPGSEGVSAIQTDEKSDFIAEATVFSGFAGEVRPYFARSSVRTVHFSAKQNAPLLFRRLISEKY